jgi:serine/threonine-protein kinase
VRAQQWVQAADLLIDMARKDPKALHDRVTADAARATAIAAVNLNNRRAGRVLEVLAYNTGSAGVEVLYEMAIGSDRPEPAQRAAELLRQPSVAARAAPATRVAFELRDAPCNRKLRLLDRAVKEGDRRALAAMETNVAPCFGSSPQVTAAMQRLRKRLGAD